MTVQYINIILKQYLILNFTLCDIRRSKIAVYMYRSPGDGTELTKDLPDTL